MIIIPQAYLSVGIFDTLIDKDNDKHQPVFFFTCMVFKQNPPFITPVLMCIQSTKHEQISIAKKKV
jgi:hypothetical protein